jgi:hypothetical protein
MYIGSFAMDAAALLFLVSGIGVAFGWQPMPDGSQRYEYVVQVEPEVAKTLAEGHSIPIVGDIPDEVHPVGRIRLVVGREAPPRQRLVTHLKPATGAGGEPNGVEQAQYNRYGDQPYTTAPAVQQPPTAAPTGAANPYAPAQPQATNQLGGESAWNNEEPPITPTESTPPSGTQLFGQPATGSTPAGNSWNSSAATESAANAAAQTAASSVAQLGAELQRAAQPAIRQGLERIDSEVRGAADSFGDRTRGLVKELQQPFQQPQLPADSRPPAASSSTNEQHSWNQDEGASTSNNPLRNSAADAGATWNDQGAGSNPTAPRTNTTPLGSSPAPTGNAGGASINWNNAPGIDGANPTPQQPRGADPWAGVPDPRPPAGVGAAGVPGEIPGLATRPLPFGGLGTNPAATGPQFPNVDSLGQQPKAPVAHAPGSVGDANSPVVRSDMLQQPADRPLDGNATQPLAATQTPAATTSVQGATQAPSTVTANVPTTAAQTGATAPAPRDNTVAVLFAWVLLSGSIAGNLYLFWSYLDVRQKYRSLVRKTARAVGSRFSAA